MSDETNLPPPDPIGAVTEVAMEHYLAGRMTEAREAFKARDGLARELYPANPNDADLPSADNLVAEIEAAGWQGETLIREWGDQAPERIRKAVRFLQSSPELQAQWASAPAHARPDLIALAYAHAERLGLPMAVVNETPREADVLPTARMSAQHRIDALLKDNPPGTPGYRDQAVQRELRELYQRVHGGGPIVGTGGRTV